MHLLNLALSREITLSPSVSLRVMSKEELCRVYPFDERWHRRPYFTRDNWLNHRVEAVVKIRESGTDLADQCTYETIDQIEKTFTHAHLLCCFDEYTRIYPVYTRLLANGVLRRTILSSLYNYSICPRPLEEPEIALLASCFSLLCCDRLDKYLERAIDKFLSGRKQDIQHPNTANTPNWDKITDYVVAFEAILLAGKKTDLALRFKLNGAWMLSNACQLDKKDAFSALGHLYSLRSAVVHGYDLVSARKSAKKFLGALPMLKNESIPDLEIISEISRTVEIWLQKLFIYLIGIPEGKRPYICEEAWENMYLGLGGLE